MSINPIDILRSQEASQIKYMGSQKAQHTQEQINQNFQKMIQKENEKPTQAANADSHEFRYDAKEEGNNKYYGSDRNKKDKKEEHQESNHQKNPKDPNRGNGFDVLI